MVALREKNPNNINKTGGVDGACYWASRFFSPIKSSVFNSREEEEKCKYVLFSSVTDFWWSQMLHMFDVTKFKTRLTRRLSLVEQELPTLPDHLSSPPVFSGVRVTLSLVSYICIGHRCLFFCTFSFGHCVVYSIYRLWLPLWYLQTLLTSFTKHCSINVRETPKG